MSMGYYEIYRKRLNRWGNDYSSRVQGEREELFDRFLNKTIYRVDFEFGENIIDGSLERWKQDQTKTLQYLKVRRTVELPSGTIISIVSKDSGDETKWLIYYKEKIEASGYNKYVVLQLTHYIEWFAADGTPESSWAYMYGQEDNMLKDELRSRSRMFSVYGENLKLNFLVLPVQRTLKKDLYLEITTSGITEGYVVTGFDIQSTVGVEYVSMRPVPLRDRTPAPVTTSTDNSKDFYWLGG